MKTIICLDCDQKFVGSTKEEVMNLMMPHYAEMHKDVMEAGNEEERSVWMKKFDESWNNATEI